MCIRVIQCVIYDNCCFDSLVHSFPCPALAPPPPHPALKINPGFGFFVKINLQESLVITYKRAYLFIDDHLLNPGFGLFVKINLQESLVITYKRAYLFIDDHFLNPGFGLFVKINLQESLVIHR